MSIAHALPYLILAVVLGAAGYLAGAVTDPFQPQSTSIRGDLAPKALRLSLHRELEQARSKTASLTSDIERAQSTIDRLRAQLETRRSRIAELQQRAETAEQARARAQARIGALGERVAALEARNAATPTPSDDTGRTDTLGPDAGDVEGQPAEGSGPPTPDALGTPEGVGANAPVGSPRQTVADAMSMPDAATPDTATPDTATPDTATPEPAAPGGADATDGPAAQQAKAGSANQAEAERADGESDASDGLGEASAPDDGGAAARADGAGPRAATEPEAGPSDNARDQRPGASALSPIDPTTPQADRLRSGVQAYQETAYAEAFRAWLPLAQAGYVRAQLHLGALFLEGRGTERNDALAYAWLTIARDHGSQSAGPLLERLRDRMTDADMDTAERLLTRARRIADNAS